MATAIVEYVIEYNKTAKKFNWKYDHTARRRSDSNITSARDHKPNGSSTKNMSASPASPSDLG